MTKETHFEMITHSVYDSHSLTHTHTRERDKVDMAKVDINNFYEIILEEALRFVCSIDASLKSYKNNISYAKKDVNKLKL